MDGVDTGIPLPRALLGHPLHGRRRRHGLRAAPAAGAGARAARAGRAGGGHGRRADERHRGSARRRAGPGRAGRGDAAGPGSDEDGARGPRRAVRRRPGGARRRRRTVAEGDALVPWTSRTTAPAEQGAADAVDPDAVRPDLADVVARHAFGLDEQRPEAVAKRHAAGRRTARENIEDLCDPGTFTEFGALAVAAQRQRRPWRSWSARRPPTAWSPAPGGSAVPAVAMSYDYTVLAGTQGLNNHRKTDRMLHVAEERGLPVVLFAEGGGGRPGDTDTTSVAGLNVTTFHRMARLSGKVPLVGIASGRCFAGNAALLGSCDVIIATPEANIGMGGPAMIGRRLWVHRAEGHRARCRCRSRTASWTCRSPTRRRRCGSPAPTSRYFQGPRDGWEAPDQRLLRHAVPGEPAARLRRPRRGRRLADTGSVLETAPRLRRRHRHGARPDRGPPAGADRQRSGHLGGAVDRTPPTSARPVPAVVRGVPAAGALAVRHPRLHGRPGRRTHRHGAEFADLFAAGARLTVPLVCLVLRKAYGLGAMAMMGGSTAGTARHGGLAERRVRRHGPGGRAVRLGYRRELAAIADPAERSGRSRRGWPNCTSAAAAERAAALEIDAVIDPARPGAGCWRRSTRALRREPVGGPSPAARRRVRRVEHQVESRAARALPEREWRELRRRPRRLEGPGPGRAWTVARSGTGPIMRISVVDVGSNTVRLAIADARTGHLCRCTRQAQTAPSEQVDGREKTGPVRRGVDRRGGPGGLRGGRTVGQRRAVRVRHGHRQGRAQPGRGAAGGGGGHRLRLQVLPGERVEAELTFLPPRQLDGLAGGPARCARHRRRTLEVAFGRGGCRTSRSRCRWARAVSRGSTCATAGRPRTRRSGRVRRHVRHQLRDVAARIRWEGRSRRPPPRARSPSSPGCAARRPAGTVPSCAGS